MLKKGSSPAAASLKRPYQSRQTFVLDDTRHTHTLLPLAVSHRLEHHILDQPSHHPPASNGNSTILSAGNIKTFAREYALVKLWHA